VILVDDAAERLAAAHRDSKRHEAGCDMEQWEYEVTSGGRVRHVIDDGNRAVWPIRIPAPPKDTDR
jgi:hypothetical protein